MVANKYGEYAQIVVMQLSKAFYVFFIAVSLHFSQVIVLLNIACIISTTVLLNVGSIYDWYLIVIEIIIDSEGSILISRLSMNTCILLFSKIRASTDTV